MDRNIFGLHLSQDSDLSKAVKIINNNGNWGWATIVIQNNDLNPPKWQRFFDECRRLHIQPIIRLATRFENGVWQKPDKSQIDDLANLLAKLNWPTDKLPIVLFNEVNHATEWGGKIDPKEYADLAIYATEKLKALNSNFVIMGAGLDLAAPEKEPNFKSAENFYREIYLYRKEYFEKMDALASHSYPNPGFVGLPMDSGKMSIRGYKWELDYLKSLGVEKEYMVYITETGWPSREEDGIKSRLYSRKTTANLMQESMGIWKSDPQILAVTFFTFNYPYFPFAKFSWVNKEENLYPELMNIFDMEKGENRPSQTEKNRYMGHELPIIIFGDIAMYGEIKLKNEGQSIWGEDRKCFDPLPNEFQLIPLCLPNGVKIEPGNSYNFSFSFRVPKDYNKDIRLQWERVDPLTLPQLVRNVSVFQARHTIFDILLIKLKSLL